MSDNMRNRKLYPRNATARSHHWVVGNPVTTRPESGVDNCYPGLEFDQRNLDKRFVTGLEFEFHTAGVLRTIDPAKQPAIANAIAESDLQAGVVLRAVHGQFGEARDGNRVYSNHFAREMGLLQWRLIHDLEPGPLVIGLGPFTGGPEDDKIAAAFEDYISNAGKDPLVERDGNGALQFAFFPAHRATYLTEDGVIDPADYKPGDLTRSLCSPWQYDFALCGCFYWASNKPDIVQKDADSPQYSNFQRLRGVNEPPLRPIANSGEWEGRTTPTLQEFDMTVGWEKLPAVFNRVEGLAVSVAPAIVLQANDILDRQAVIDSLRQLAPVEHGLMVEYLYAYYSIDRQAYADGSQQRKVVDAAASTVLSVAIDEMRHLRWVNEMLRSLGEPHEFGRFETMPDIANDGRVLDHQFSLQRFSSQRLDWFIRVEAPSDRIDVDRAAGTIDGMYTRLLLSVVQGNDFSEREKQELAHLLKLVIDEGQDHFERFTLIKQRLSGLDPSDYLRLPDDPQPVPVSSPAHVFQAVADATYRQAIDLLSLIFSSQIAAPADALLVGAREIMYNLDEAADVASQIGGAPLFTLPGPIVVADFAEEGGAALTPATFVDRHLRPELEAALTSVRGFEGGETMARSMQARLDRAQVIFAELE